MLQYIEEILAEILRKRGMQNLIKGNYQKAGICFQKALKLADTTANRFNLGLYLLSSQHFEEAEEIFAGIAEEYPENEINSLLLFESYMLLEKWEAAINQICKLEQQNPTAKKYQILRNVAEDVVAREKYRKVKILKSEAQEHLAAKNREQALQKYLEAEQYSPADSEILNNIGSIFIRTRDYIRAYTYFENAIRLDPDNRIINKNLILTKSKLRIARKNL